VIRYNLVMSNASNEAVTHCVSCEEALDEECLAEEEEEECEECRMWCNGFDEGEAAERRHFSRGD